MASTLIVPLSDAANPESAETRKRLSSFMFGSSPSIRKALSSVCRAFEATISDRRQATDFSWLVSKMCDLNQEQLYTIRGILNEYDSDPSDELLGTVISAIAEVVTRTVHDGNAVSPETKFDGSDEFDGRRRLWKHREHVATRVRDLRESQNLSQQDLAKLTGLSQSVISRIENAGYCNQGRTIKLLAKALRVEPGAIDTSF